MSREPLNEIQLLTIAEVAARLGVSRARVAQWIGEARIRVADERGRQGSPLVAETDAVRPQPRKRGPRPRGKR